MPVSVEKIKELLGNGLSNEVVATAVGVHPSYVSQLMSDDVFSSEVVTLRTQSLAAASGRDRTWDSLEDKLLMKLHEVVDAGMIYKANDITRIVAIANNAKRRGVSTQQSLTVHQNIVNLNIPAAALTSYRKSSTNEVVEVTTDDKVQTLVTMPASALMQKLTEQHQGDKNYEQVRKYLPRRSETEIIKG